MTDASHSSFRTFDPAQEEGAVPPQRSALRERLRQGSPAGSVPEDTPAAQQPVRTYDPVTMGPGSAAEDEGLRPLSQTELAERAPPRPEAPKAAPEPVPQAASEPDILSENATQPIGVVLEIAGSGSQIAIDLLRLNECMEDADPSVALAGQVGSQIKIRVGQTWLLASVRNQKQGRGENSVIANIDFLGEGQEERLTGKLHGFKRGVTRYPVPGALVYPATTPDLRQVYASDGRDAITIGKVYP
ncbi:MAG TPA: ATPase, partial [Qipengyuania sp.]|nr:ATPase [Qipengyuania sp.]